MYTRERILKAKKRKTLLIKTGCDIYNYCDAGIPITFPAAAALFHKIEYGESTVVETKVLYI